MTTPMEMTDRRKYHMVVLKRTLSIWAGEADRGCRFLGDSDTCLCLIAACEDDYRAGGVSPLPWLALADFIEERGLITAIRRHAEKAYGLPLSSPY